MKLNIHARLMRRHHADVGFAFLVSQFTNSQMVVAVANSLEIKLSFGIGVSGGRGKAFRIGDVNARRGDWFVRSRIPNMAKDLGLGVPLGGNGAR